MPLRLQLLSSREAARLLPQALTVIPAGSLEQHCNGPLGLDALLAEALAWRACERLEGQGAECIIAPTLAYGFSPEWAAAPGTITLGAATFVEAVKQIVSSLARSGAKRIAIVNGHAGNSGLLEAAAREAALENPEIVVAAIDYWRPAGARVGHCIGLEEALAKTILGIELDCDCPKTIQTPPYRVATGPHGTAGIPSSPADPETIVENLARALGEVLRLNPGDPKL